MDVQINLDQSVQSEPRMRLQLAENLLRDACSLIHRLEVQYGLTVSSLHVLISYSSFPQVKFMVMDCDTPEFFLFFPFSVCKCFCFGTTVPIMLWVTRTSLALVHHEKSRCVGCWLLSVMSVRVFCISI